MSAAIVLFRRDLRLNDHAALHAAIASGLRVIPLYVHAPEEDGNWQPGGATRAWLARSLAALDQSLRKLGSRLVLRRGRTLEVVVKVAAQTDASAVYWHRLYEPAAVARDAQLKQALKAQGLIAESFPGYLLNEPWSIKTQVGDVYRVFTPYWRNAQKQITQAIPLRAPEQLSDPAVSGIALAELNLAAKPAWDQGFWEVFTPGEAGAAEALELFLDDALNHYADGRNRPDQRGTSRLSPHLHFGEISVRQLVHALGGAASPAAYARAEPYLRELGWRDFSQQLLYHYPHTADAPLNASFAEFPWASIQPAKLRAWQRGETGIPIIDAGMRELIQTGWMHNRVRMIVASLLTKNLRYPWQEGARWFWDTLVDADLANNSQGWQWSAGCGADAAPYFRIFNPVTQGERFDANGDYVRKFVPELRGLSAKTIHQPWLAGGVAGYPKPIVDLKTSREAALAAFAQFRGKGGESAAVRSE